MVRAVREVRPAPSNLAGLHVGGIGHVARSSDDTAEALAGDDEYVCADCDARQIEPIDRCPSCGGVVVGKKDMVTSDYDPLIGRKIGGRFTVIARLGAGSMGAVYRARQDGMAREVALKVLKPERAFDAGSKSRFEREARATSALTSPHTVTVYDFGEDDSTAQGPLLYLAMERLEGEPLGQRLKRVGRIPPFEAVKIAQQALRSLAEAHEKGVVHRDLKPDNIFLHKVPTPHGLEEVVKVLDFGIAKILQPDLKVDSLETQAGTVFGTPRYMSPEQAQSKPLDGRSDLYTIGLILFQMVTGRHVFPDEDAVVVMARHIQSLPPRPRELAPDAGISRKLEAVILKALAKDPKRRPQTALELHEDLDAALREGPAEAASVPPPRPDPANFSSLGPVADASSELRFDPQPLALQRRSRSQIAAFSAGFAFLLLAAVALGVKLAQSPGPSTVVEPTDRSGNVAPATTSAETARPTVAIATTTAPLATTPPPATTDSGAKPPKVAATAATKTRPTVKTSGAPVASAPPSVVETAPPTATTAAPPAPSSTKKGAYGKFD